jgi:hypothetical protein
MRSNFPVSGTLCQAVASLNFGNLGSLKLLQLQSDRA